MTFEEELNQFRKREKTRQRRAKTTAVVFGVMAMIALLEFAYAFAKQIESDRASVTHEIQLNKVKEAIKIAEEKATKFEELAKQETEATRALDEACQKKATTIK